MIFLQGVRYSHSGDNYSHRCDFRVFLNSYAHCLMRCLERHLEENCRVSDPILKLVQEMEKKVKNKVVDYPLDLVRNDALFKK